MHCSCYRPASAEQLANSSKPIGIVGWIVDSPAKLVNGYTGDAPEQFGPVAFFRWNSRPHGHLSVQPTGR